MPKRRRLYTPAKYKKVNHIKDENDAPNLDREVSTARGRLKGALKGVLEPSEEESDSSYDPSPMKRERKISVDNNKKDYTSEEEDKHYRKKSPPRQSYVLKLFDRSVDLSQFKEDTPLYPICRAWIANQPKMIYSEMSKKYDDPEPTEDSVELPGPEGPPMSRIPDLLPEQEARDKDNINLNYREAPPPSREQLLSGHAARWARVRHAWVRRAALLEERYTDTQKLLNKINVNTL